MEKWSYYNPTRIYFGLKRLDLIKSIKQERIALITTKGFIERGVVEQINEMIENRLVAIIDSVTSNPGVGDIDAILPLLKKHSPDCLIALGGGSSIDTAKALSLLIPASGSSITSHFRSSEPIIVNKNLPVYAIPTTAGTGSEVTPFATIWDFTYKKKYSLMSDDLFPNTALIDPLLTLDLPESLTISTGLDAISHAFESIWNKNANPITISLSTQSLHMSLQALPVVKKDPHNLKARTQMLEASLMAGLAISQTRTALAHSISYPITINYAVPHGIACGFTLPTILRFNAKADDGRLLNLSKALGYSSLNSLIRALNKLFKELDVPSYLFKNVPNIDQMLKIINEMITPGRADNNLRSATVNDVKQIIYDFYKNESPG